MPVGPVRLIKILLHHKKVFVLKKSGSVPTSMLTLKLWKIMIKVMPNLSHKCLYLICKLSWILAIPYSLVTSAYTTNKYESQQIINNVPLKICNRLLIVIKTSGFVSWCRAIENNLKRVNKSLSLVTPGYDKKFLQTYYHNQIIQTLIFLNKLNVKIHFAISARVKVIVFSW